MGGDRDPAALPGPRITAKLKTAAGHAPAAADGLEILELYFEFNNGEAAAAARPDVKLIILADHSGSMSGSWERTAVPAIKYVFEQAMEAGNVHLTLICFNDKAKTIDADSFLSELEKTRATGGTSFGAGYERVIEIIEHERDALVSSSHPVSIVLALFTDGQDMQRATSQRSFEKLQKLLRTLGPSVPSVCHCIGFTSSIDMPMLDAIRQGLGTQPGEFQFAAEGDAEGLKERLELLVHVAKLGPAARPARVSLSLEGYTIVEDSLVAPTAGRTATREIRPDGHGAASLTFTVRRDPSAAADAPLLVQAVVSGEAGAQELTCMAAVEPASTPFAAANLGLQVCDARIEALGRSCAGLKEAGSLARGWEEKLRALAAAVAAAKQPAQLRALGNRSHARAAVLELADSLTAQVTRLTESLSALVSGASSTGARARMAEIAYGAQFAKARRARTMATLAVRNAAAADELEARLKAFTVDLDAIGTVPPESLAFFRCSLTTCGWVDLLLGAEGPGGGQAAEERDVLGFGIAVGRPEHVIDDPNHLRIFSISNTLAARTAFSDSVKYGIDVRGPEATHGGFQLASRGVAFTGISREPVNAWMPLYISATHWRLVRILWKPSVAYFVTLNPLAYADKQADAALLLLGTMAARMAAPSDREATLFFAYLRTAIAAAQEPETGVGERARTMLTRFLRDAKSVQNMVTLLGAILALPDAELAALVPDAAAEAWLWETFVCEALRRSVYSVLSPVRDVRDKGDQQTGYAHRIGALVDALLTGDRAVAAAAATRPEEAAALAAARFPAAAEALWGALEALHEARMAGLAATDDSEAKAEAAFAARARALLVTPDALREAQRSAYERSAGASFEAYADQSYKRYYKKERRLVRRQGRSARRFMAWEGEAASSALRAEWREYLRNTMTVVAAAKDAAPAPTPAPAPAQTSAAAAQPVAGPSEPALAASGVEAPGMEAARAHAWAWLAARFNERGIPMLGQTLSAFAALGAWRRIARAAGGTAAACAVLDGNGGVAPGAWVAALKEALAQREAAPESFRTLFGALGWELPAACLPADQAAAPGPFASRWWTMYSHEVAGPAKTGAEAAEAARAVVVHATQMNVTLQMIELEKDAAYRNPVREPAGYLAYITALREREARAAYAARAARSREESLMGAMATTRDLAAFAGMVRELSPYRADKRFGALLERFATPGAAAMPLGAAKLRVLLSGVFEEAGLAAPILDAGRPWAPARPLAARLATIWGASVYT